MKMYESNPPANPKVSILVPVCNTSKYLPQCLDSLVSQTLKNIEIICLNDGSTDESLDILKRYQAADSRIRVVDKPNSGYGSTMNLGISLAKGEYVGIVESDDFAEKNMFKKLYRAARWHKCDIAKGSYFEHSEQGDAPQEPFKEFRYNRPFDPRENIWVTCVLPIIWAAIYKREMLVVNNVRFNETPGASFQDTSFVFQCWAASRKVVLIKDCLLHYRVDNAGSSVKSGKKVFTVCDEYELSQEFLNEDPERLKAFGEIINVLKLGTYRWNYWRITDDCKKDFALRMADEYRAARANGSLNEKLFAPQDWALLQELMSDSEAFCRNHGEAF